MGNQGLFPGRVSEANQGRGQPRRGYRRPKPATHSGAGRKSRRAAGFLLHTFLSPSKEKCERPMGRQVPIRAVVGASFPSWGKEYAPAGAPKGFPRGKQSARPALPRFADGLPELLRPIKKDECRFIRTALHPCQRSPSFLHLLHLIPHRLQFPQYALLRQYQMQ